MHRPCKVKKQQPHRRQSRKLMLDYQSSKSRNSMAKYRSGRNSGTPMKVQVHKNDSLADVEKFAYLRSQLQDPARSAIAGFALTSANYEAAVKLLKKRYSKEEAIQRAHINDLLNLSPVYNDVDTSRLCRFYDAAYWPS